MSRVDPRSKLFLVASLSTLSVIYRNIGILFVLLLCSLVLAMLFGGDLIGMYHKLKVYVNLLVGMALIQSIFTSQGTPIIYFGDFTILTSYGLEKGLEFILRIGIILILASILATSSQREVTQGLVQLKVPYELAFMSTLGARFLPVFKEEFVDSLNALMLRGVDVKKLKWKKKVKVYTYILSPIVINSYLRAKEMAIAMEIRGFRLRDNRTSLLELQLNVRDYMIMGISIAIFVAGIIGRICL